jgi:acyl carrier protein
MMKKMRMTKMKTNLERLQMMIIERIPFEGGEISLELNLHNDLELDSLDVVELTLEVEKEFDIRISDKEMEEWETVKDVLDSIENHKI